MEQFLYLVMEMRSYQRKIAKLRTFTPEYKKLRAECTEIEKKVDDAIKRNKIAIKIQHEQLLPLGD